MARDAESLKLRREKLEELADLADKAMEWPESFQKQRPDDFFSASHKDPVARLYVIARLYFPGLFPEVHTFCGSLRVQVNAIMKHQLGMTDENEHTKEMLKLKGDSDISREALFGAIEKFATTLAIRRHH